MNRAGRTAAFFLIICLMLGLCSGAVSAAAMELGGVYVYMPEIRVELKNADESTALTGQLDSEPLQLQKLETYDPAVHSKKIYLLADLSTSMRGSESEMKERMKQIAGHLGPNDRVSLVTFGTQVRTVLEDCGDPDEIRAAIDAIECNEDDTLLCEAMQQIYQQSVASYPSYDRQYAIVFSDFEDFQIGSATYDEVQSSYTSRMLPLYGVFTSSTSQADADKFGQLCRRSGGDFIPMRTTEAAFDESLDAIDKVALACFEAGSNYADGSNKLLTVRAGGTQQNVMVPVVMSREDTQPPQVLSAEYNADNGIITVVFSEPVRNADRPDSYELRSPGGTVQLPNKVSYHRDTHSAEIEITPSEAGDYALTFHDITDDSAQRNVLRDSVPLNIEIRDWQPAEEEAQEPVPPEKNALPGWLWPLLLALLALIVAAIVAAAAWSAKKRKAQEEEAGVNYETINNQVIASEVHRHIVNEKKARLHMSLKTGRNEELDIVQDISSSAIFGRSGTCDVCIDDQKLSRQHFAIECENGRLFLSDLQSTNGTMLNGIRIGARRELHPRDMILAGQTEIRVLEIQ